MIPEPGYGLITRAKCSRDTACKLRGDTQQRSSRRIDGSHIHLDDEELLHSGEETAALSNQWGITNLPSLDELLTSFPELQISYARRDDASESFFAPFLD